MIDPDLALAEPQALSDELIVAERLIAELMDPITGEEAPAETMHPRDATRACHLRYGKSRKKRLTKRSRG